MSKEAKVYFGLTLYNLLLMLTISIRSFDAPSPDVMMGLVPLCVSAFGAGCTFMAGLYAVEED